MDFQDTIDYSLFYYPSLFFGDKWCEYRAMDHLFFVIGNGFEWKDGELTKKYHEEKQGRTWQNFVTRALKEFDSRPKYLEMIHNLNKVAARYKGKKNAEFRFYSTSSKYSKAFLVPDDVKKDWLEGVIHFLEFALTRPLESFYFYHEDWDEQKEIEFALEKRSLVEKQLEKLHKLYKDKYGQ